MTNTSNLGLDEAMTVRCLDRSGWGTSRAYPTVQEVTISTSCPRCGAQRGRPRPLRFHEDGEWITCDVWNNPCGHIDHYTRVIEEAKDQAARHRLNTVTSEEICRLLAHDPDSTPGLYLERVQASDAGVLLVTLCDEQDHEASFALTVTQATNDHGQVLPGTSPC